MSQPKLTREAEEYLEDLADELEVPESRYQQAERSYKSLGEWLNRDASSVRQFDPHVYVQGSFRLGTTIRPLNEAEEYDIDSVCELKKLTKGQLSQFQLKQLLGAEVNAYHNAQGMIKPVREGRRCWILDYADGAQFHMDIVPALTNELAQRHILEARGLDTRWTATAIAITDREAPNYVQITDDWPRSNPKGYSEWFKSRMAAIFERRRRRLAEGARAGVEQIPDYKVRTPLQSAIMILKRHRDHCFINRSDVRPISVILTTLSAHSYQGEDTIGQALVSILQGMDSHIQVLNGRYWIPNPTDPLENFADKWAAHPERTQAFFGWLEQARREFAYAATLANRDVISETVAKGVGPSIAERARRRRSGTPSMLRAASVAPAAAPFSFPDTARVPAKPQGFG